VRMCISLDQLDQIKILIRWKSIYW